MRAAPRPSLSRDAIVDAALRVVDREGLEATSMHRVAHELGTASSALYRHVHNPHTLALLDVLFEGDRNERFEFGLDVLVRGLASLAAESGQKRSDARRRR